MAELTYTLEGAAQALGISRPSMYKLLHREDFPAYKVGAHWKISKAALADWSDRQAKERATL